MRSEKFLGIVCWEIFEDGKLPYEGMADDEVIEKVKIGYKLPCPTKCPQELYKVHKYRSNSNERLFSLVGM